MNLEVFMMVELLLVPAVMLALIVFILPLRARLRAQQNSNATGGTPPVGDQVQANQSGWSERSKVILTLLSLVLILAGFFLWDWHYNDANDNGWGDILTVIIDKPLLAVGATITIVASIWCAVNFLAEPARWAKYVGGVIVITLVAIGTIPLSILLFGDDWFQNLIDNWSLGDWSISTIITIVGLIALWIWGFWSDRKESKK